MWRVAPAVVGVSAEVTSAQARVWTVKGTLAAGWKLLSDAGVVVAGADVGANAGGRAAAVGGRTEGPPSWKVQLDVSVPIGLVVQATLPAAPATADDSALTVGQCSVVLANDGGVTVWSNGKYKPGAAGVSAGSIATGHNKETGITFTVGSGRFSFVMVC